MDISIDMKPITCCSCGFTFAVPCVWLSKKKTEHSVFWCPSCQTPQSFQGQTDAEKYRKLYEHAQQCCERHIENANHLERKYWGMKGYAAKIKKQVSNQAASVDRENDATG